MQVVRALALAKKAITKFSADKIGAAKAKAIAQAADEVIAGKLDEHFPLKVWQTGSGTQSNMNVNEVLAFRASQISGEKVHANDDCNYGQSSNDIFPTGMHIAAYMELKTRLVPALEAEIAALEAKAAEFKDVVKIAARTSWTPCPCTSGTSSRPSRTSAPTRSARCGRRCRHCCGCRSAGPRWAPA